jgi:hypothetical protein
MGGLLTLPSGDWHPAIRAERMKKRSYDVLL